MICSFVDVLCYLSLEFLFFGLCEEIMQVKMFFCNGMEMGTRQRGRDEGKKACFVESEQKKKKKRCFKVFLIVF